MQHKLNNSFYSFSNGYRFYFRSGVRCRAAVGGF